MVSRVRYWCGIYSQPQDTIAQANPKNLQAPGREWGSCGAADSSKAWTCPHCECPSAEGQDIPRNSLGSGLGMVLSARAGVDQAESSVEYIQPVEGTGATNASKK